MEHDESVKNEIIDSFNDLANEIEIAVDRLNQGTHSNDDLHYLFRSIHTIKGNAAMVQLKDIVAYTHSLEEVFEALRDQKFNATDSVCEILQLGMDRLRDLHHRDLFGHQFENLHEKTLQALFQSLSKANPAEVDQYCRKILETLGAGFIHNDDDSSATEEYEPIECLPLSEGDSKQAFDMRFFRELAEQVDRQSSYWEGRSQQIHDWAQKINAMGDYPVNAEQLAAATYMHDIGMSFIPNQILEKEGRLTEEELAQIRKHTIWGYNYMLRIPGWHEAATIVLEHHERIDGEGYPNGNKGNIIHDGAKIIAIVDAFFSITNGRADRARRRSVVRAVSEINARIGTQFDEKWVNAFNKMIKNELKSGAL